MADQKKHTSLHKHKILISGICILIIASSFIIFSTGFLYKMYLCKHYNGDLFMPNTSVTVTCNVVGDVWQDLVLRVDFRPNGSPDSIQIPAHLEMKDPNGIILYDLDFNNKTIISFKPEKLGTYTATITSLEDENNRVHRGYTDIVYALGFLTSYKDVSNPMGHMINVLLIIGYVLFLPGIILVIYGAIREFKIKSKV